MNIIHDKPYGPKYGRIITIKAVGKDIHYWKIPFTDPEVARQKKLAEEEKQKAQGKKGRMSKAEHYEKIALERGGTVRDIKK